jgi:hypothetical protein
MTTEGQNTEVLSREQKKFMVITEYTVALIGYERFVCPMLQLHVSAFRRFLKPNFLTAETT